MIPTQATKLTLVDFFLRKSISRMLELWVNSLYTPCPVRMQPFSRVLLINLWYFASGHNSHFHDHFSTFNLCVHICLVDTDIVTRTCFVSWKGHCGYMMMTNMSMWRDRNTIALVVTHRQREKRVWQRYLHTVSQASCLCQAWSFFHPLM